MKRYWGCVEIIPNKERNKKTKISPTKTWLSL